MVAKSNWVHWSACRSWFLETSVALMWHKSFLLCNVFSQKILVKYSVLQSYLQQGTYAQTSFKCLFVTMTLLASHQFSRSCIHNNTYWFSGRKKGVCLFFGPSTLTHKIPARMCSAQLQYGGINLRLWRKLLTRSQGDVGSHYISLF